MSVVDDFVNDEEKRIADAAQGGGDDALSAEELAAKLAAETGGDTGGDAGGDSNPPGDGKGDSGKGDDSEFTLEELNALSEDERKGLVEEFEGAGFDAAGNVVDDKGEIIVKADEVLAALNEEAPEDPLVVKAIGLTGFELTNESGEPLSFKEDTPENIVEVSKALANKYVESIEEQRIKKHPELEDVYNHLSLHGNLNDYNKETTATFKNIALTEDTTKEEYVNLLTTKYIALNNMSREQAVKFANIAADEETWKEEGTKALKELVQLENDRDAQKAAAVKAKRDADALNTKTYWEKVDGIISKGALDKNITVPEKDRTKFFEYLSKPTDGRGLSQAQLDAKEENLSTSLIYSFLRYKKINFKELIQAEQQSSKVMSLRERIRASRDNKSKGSDSLPKGKSRAATGDNFPDISQIS